MGSQSLSEFKERSLHYRAQLRRMNGQSSDAAASPEPEMIFRD